MKNIKREERPVFFDVCTLTALTKLIKQIMLFCTGPPFFFWCRDASIFLPYWPWINPFRPSRSMAIPSCSFVLDLVDLVYVVLTGANLVEEFLA
jgi:hypothetical protein